MVWTGCPRVSRPARYLPGAERSVDHRVGRSRVSTPKLLGVLVTFRRPRDLETSLAVLSDQKHLLDRLVVVDNDPTPLGEQIVAAADGAAAEVVYLPMMENAGFPGGLAAGIETLLAAAADSDWIVVLDDDDPPDSFTVLGELLNFAEQAVAADPHTAAVGLRGARFDRRRGLLRRVSTSDLEGHVPVDCIAGNALPLYRASALRRAGSFLGPLFFSHEELEIGLRLEAAGFALYADGVQWRRRRTANDRPDVADESRWELLHPNWRSYYSLRNTVFVLRQHGRRGTALKVGVVRGLLKPMLHLPVHPSAALRALRINRRAFLDGWRERLGRRMEPDVSVPRPKRTVTTA